MNCIRTDVENYVISPFRFLNTEHWSPIYSIRFNCFVYGTTQDIFRITYLNDDRKCRMCSCRVNCNKCTHYATNRGSDCISFALLKTSSTFSSTVPYPSPPSHIILQCVEKAFKILFRLLFHDLLTSFLWLFYSNK